MKTAGELHGVGTPDSLRYELARGLLPKGNAPNRASRVAIAALYVAFVSGYGAFEGIYKLRPTFFILFELLCVVIVGFSVDRQVLQSLFVPLPAIGFVLWWLSSYFWSSFQAGFSQSTRFDLAMVGSIVFLGGIIPFAYFLRTLLRAGYICIALIVVAFAIDPASAYQSTATAADVAGLRGGFVHKNIMSACLLLTLLLVLCFSARRAFRVSFTLLVAGLLFFSRSGTGIVTFLLMEMTLQVALHWFSFAARARRGGKVLMFVFVAFLSVVTVAISPLLLVLVGRTTTFSGRTDIWSQVLRQIAKRPFQGYGWGGVFVDLGREPTLSIIRAIGYPVFHSHNAALELMFRLGVIGLVLYLLQLFATIRIGAALARQSHRLGVFTLVTAVIIVSFAVSEIETVFGLWYALTIALCTAARREIRDSQP
jgi:O-antigen ligase